MSAKEHEAGTAARLQDAAREGPEQRFHCQLSPAGRQVRPQGQGHIPPPDNQTKLATPAGKATPPPPVVWQKCNLGLPPPSSALPDVGSGFQTRNLRATGARYLDTWHQNVFGDTAAPGMV